MTRPNLVIVRGGDRSLHPVWMDHEGRDWDLLLSYYGDRGTPARGAHDALHRCKGTKWQGLADLFATRPELLSQYEAVWLPDDDLFTDGKTIDGLFAAARRHAFDLCQPALTPYSFVTHPITLQRSDCLHRVTDFVEVMAPLFSARAAGASADLRRERLGLGARMALVEHLRARGLAHRHHRHPSGVPLPACGFGRTWRCRLTAR